MNTKKRIASCLVALVFPFATLAAETQTVVATGYGTTADDAKKAAIRAAVEQVVGTMIDAETLVENDELVQDQILSYSAGLVDSAEFVGAPKTTDGGLVQVRIRAVVRKTEIEAKLPKTEKVVHEVSGQSLFAKRVSGKQNLEDAEAVMKKVFDPENVRSCIKADLVPLNDSGAVLDVDPATGEVFANVKVWVDMDAYKKWTKEIVEKLGPMAESKHSGVMIDSAKEKLKAKRPQIEFFPRPWPFGDIPEYCNIIVVSNLRSFSVTGLVLDKSKTEILGSVFCRKAAAVRVCLLNASGDAISEKESGIGWSSETLYMFEEGASSILAPSWGMLLALPVACMNHQDGAHELDVLFRDTGTMRVSFGKMDETDIAEIASASVEVRLKDPPGIR